MKGKLLDNIYDNRKSMWDFTRDLVAVPTENPPGNHYGKCIGLIRKKLEEIGLDHEVIEIPTAEHQGADAQFRYALVATFGEGSKTLWFHGHYDVVPMSDPSQCRPRTKNRKLYGRGSADMKGGLAAMVYAVKAVKECGLKPNGKIGLIFVPDEETGGRLGSRWLSDAGILGRDGIGMLTPEPTSGVIWHANRGAVTMDITVKGKPAHVGLQCQGVNAFEQSIPLLNALLERKAIVEKRYSEYHLKPAEARHSILMLGGKTGSGSNFNLVPDVFRFTLDRRINPEENLAEEKTELMALFERFKKQGLDLDVEILQEGSSSGVPQDHRLARALSKNIRAVTGERPRFEMCPGLLEIRFYVEKGLPGFAYGPGLLSVSHGPDEYIELENIPQCAVIYARTALGYLEE
jgi:acetylornithine deacetylase/succinyl-diaminopimelate desuccinylase family protein